MDYLTYEELLQREPNYLPLTTDGSIDEAKCRAVISDASEIVRAYLPQLIDEEGVPLTPPARISGVLKTICVDIVLYRLDTRPGEEHLTERYNKAIKLLEALASGGSTLTGSSGGSGSGGSGITSLGDDVSSAFVDGYSQFISPGGMAH